MRCPAPNDLKPSLAELSRVSPGRAGDLCYHYFCRPVWSAHRSPEHDLLSRRARTQLRGAKLAWVKTPSGPCLTATFEPPGEVRQTVLAIHGWTSEGAFMAAFVGPLLSRGCRVVLCDLPGHGRSEPYAVSLIDCARGALAIVRALGPFDCVIAHSMGCIIAGLLVDGGPPLAGGTNFRRMVLISPPDKMGDITGTFADDHAITAAARRHFERRVARTGHRELAEFKTSRLLQATDAHILLVHSEDDVQIPIGDMRAIAAAKPDAAVHVEANLGHRKVLYAPPVIRRVRAFLTGD
jgi:pimeloyl-ACP methyl ester carboxylesterase